MPLTPVLLFPPAPSTATLCPAPAALELSWHLNCSHTKCCRMPYYPREVHVGKITREILCLSTSYRDCRCTSCDHDREAGHGTHGETCKYLSPAVMDILQPNWPFSGSSKHARLGLSRHQFDTPKPQGDCNSNSIPKGSS